MAVGLAVVLILVIAHWGTVRDHVEAWLFQLTTETETIEYVAYKSKGFEVVILEAMASRIPAALYECEAVGFFLLLGSESGEPVIVAVEDLSKKVRWSANEDQLEEPTLPQLARRILESNGYRVLEQRFPRRAHIVIHDASFPTPGIPLPPGTPLEDSPLEK